MKEKNEFQLSELIELFLKRNNMRGQLNGSLAVLAWKEIAGDLINKLTVSVKASNSTLYVTLSSASLRQELSYKHDSIKQKLNEKLGGNYISQIVFK